MCNEIRLSNLVQLKKYFSSFTPMTVPLLFHQYTVWAVLVNVIQSPCIGNGELLQAVGIIIVFFLYQF